METLNDPDFSEDYYKDCRTPPPPGEYLPAHAEYFHLVEDWYDISYLKQSPGYLKGNLIGGVLWRRY